MSQRDITNRRATYYATADSWVIPGTPTDMVSLKGSATKLIRLVGIIVTGNQTTAGINKFYLAKRSSADTAGTFVADAITPADSQDPAPAATFGHYTANPTLGTLVGNILGIRMLCPAAGGTTNDGISILLANTDFKPILIRGTSEELHLNFNTVALPPGMTLTVTFIWTEE